MEGNMNDRYSFPRHARFSVIIVLLSILACQSSTFLPTATPYPTLTPYPTYTPYPTHTPYPTFTALPLPAELFFEDFNGSTSCFTPYSDSVSNAQMSKGLFFLNVLKKNTIVGSTCENTTLGDFVLDVDVTTQKEANGSYYYGVSFRETGGQAYEFLIGLDKESPSFCLFYYDKTSFINLSNSLIDPESCWQNFSTKIYNNQMNTLRVIATGELLELYLNNEILFATRDSYLAAGKIGFIAGTYDNQDTIEIGFDNIRVTEP